MSIPSQSSRSARLRAATVALAWLSAWALGACDRLEAEQEPAPPPPLAQAFVSSQVSAALGQLARAATTRGFTPEGDDSRGFLVERGPQAVELPLRSGSCYLLVAAGSEAVRELDVTLYAGDGTEVARDESAGRLVALHHCPPQSGTFYASVQATAGNGLFALRVLRGPNGLEVRTEDIVRAAEPERASR
ncbi:MAG: hypothetical protein K1X94_36450 [Sandaracinaceae bacterium]|nr:hypothetical protein [Sandaracinaceae bacterium]